MNVRELIEKLSKADPDAVVGLIDSEGGAWTNFDVVKGTTGVHGSGSTAYIDEYNRGKYPAQPVVLLTRFSTDDLDDLAVL